MIENEHEGVDNMKVRKPKGHVEFKQPPVKLAADMPGDDEMREHLDEMIQNDGYQGSCTVMASQEQQVDRTEQGS
jgi:hypothetical protein